MQRSPAPACRSGGAGAGRVTEIKSGRKERHVTTGYCDVCKATTERCEFYPQGRSRQHGRCLRCDKNDSRTPAEYKPAKREYCYACNQMPSDRYRQ